jgi:hypothetical protein
MNNQIFQTPQKELEQESWRLALRQKSEKELYQEQQKEIIRSIFQ